jgi:tRNA threonylcarbamoyladenosine biosynthesis protein TsaB
MDTSGPRGSVALGADGAVLAEALLEGSAEQAARLLPAIDRVLGEAGVARTALGGLVVGEGPGSFTGVRVAAATAKGLAAALRLPLWAVSSLAAAALASDAGPVRYALFDARADRVYGACFAVGVDRVRTLVSPHPGTVRDVLDGTVPAGAVFVGDAAERHRRLIERAGFSVSPNGAGASLARGLLRYVALNAAAPAVSDVGSWEPAYVRASSASTSWTG